MVGVRACWVVCKFNTVNLHFFTIVLNSSRKNSVENRSTKQELITTTTTRSSMEKDLRDAYKALKLLRADLTRTRAEKDALAAEAAALGKDNARLRAEQAASERTTEPLGSDGDDRHQQPSAKDGEQQHEENENQQEEEMEKERRMEEMVREKLALLANLYSLKSKLDAQAAAMLAQQAAFAQERDELCMQLEELGDQLAQLQAHALDVEHEKQFIAEKYDFLITELQLLKQQEQQRDASAGSESEWRDRDAEEGDAHHRSKKAEEAADAQEHTLEEQELPSTPAAVDARELMDAKLRELESIRERLEAERRTLQNQREQTQRQSPSQPGPESDEGARNILQLEEENQSRGASIRTLEEQVRTLESANRELTGTIEALTRDNDTSAAQYEAKLEALRQEMLADTEVGVAAVRAEMEEQVARLKLAIQTHEREADDASATLDEAKRREAELLRLMGEAEAEFGAQVRHLEAVLKEQQERYEALESKCEAQQKAASGLETELDACRQQIASLTSEKQRLAETSAEAQKQLRSELERDHEARLRAKEEELQLQFAETLGVQRAQHEKLAKSSAMEAKALLQESRQLTQALKQKEDALVQSQSAVSVANAELQAAKQRAEEANAVLQRQMSALETQLLVIEDKKRPEEDEYDDLAVVDDSDANSRAWAFIQRKVRELGHFLPQLQNFAYFVDSALCVCEANARALEALSVQHMERHVTQDVVSLLRFVGQLQRGVGGSSHVKQARRLHREVTALLSNWYECAGDEEIPAPPFGIASREASLVLQNWTADKSKRAAVSRWLEQMEAATGAAWSRSSSSSSGDEALEDLAVDGSTLELQQMTTEVKQAFLMLIVPILRRNAAIYVRVFTRRVVASTSAQREDATWEMKIHVQLQRSRRGSWASSSASVRRSPQSRGRPSPLELSGLYPVTPLHADAVTTTPTSAQKLQIIQERLQHMQKR